MPSPKRTQQELAKDLYLHTQKTHQEIADILDVSKRTVFGWIKNGRWAEMKESARQAPGIILQDIHNHITAINDRIRDREDDPCPTPQEVDMLRKLIGMTTVIEKQNCGAYIQAFQELTFFILPKDKKFGQQLVKYANDYVKGTLGDKPFQAKRQAKLNISDVNNYLKDDPEIIDPTPAIHINMPPAPTPPDDGTKSENGVQQNGTEQEQKVQQSEVKAQQNHLPDNTSLPLPEHAEGGEGRGEANTQQNDIPNNTSLSCHPEHAEGGEGRGEANNSLINNKNDENEEKKPQIPTERLAGDQILGQICKGDTGGQDTTPAANLVRPGEPGESPEIPGTLGQTGDGNTGDTNGTGESGDQSTKPKQ